VSISSVYEWLNEEKSRYYKITVHKQSPHVIILNYAWGSCNSNRGGQKNILVGNDDEAHSRVLNMMKRRKSRGYQLVAPSIN
jgi:predicted DNA-binding WGR domain protein